MRFGPAFFALPFVALGLTGCTLVETAAPTPEAGAAFTGSVHGGQQPITGAHIYLFAANTTGYGNASVSLLKSATGTTLDSSGGATNGDYYVTSDANGNFSISSDYTCTSGTQVYIYALGGNPGLTAGTNNPAAGLMAALGNCPSAGNLLSTVPFVVVNEVSTVAAAYAMAGFATDALHVSSSGTTQAKAGIANAFLNALELETLSTGMANSSSPAGVGTTANGGGVMPQTEINTLGNILAACVNSTGSVTGGANPSNCYTLFTNAMSGGTTGTQPTDTATAAINIAHNPVAAVSALYNLSSAYAQFAPALTAQPNDFTVVIFYGNGLSYDGGLANTLPIAIDASGDVWEAAGPIGETNGQGYSYSGYGYSGFQGATALSLDINGNAWAVNTGAVGELSNSGARLSPSGGYSSGLGISNPASIAMDGSSNAWIGNSGAHNVVKVSSSGTLAGTFTGGGITTPGPVAIDPSGDAWIADTSTGAIVELSPTGSPLSGSAGYTGTGLTSPSGIAIDHSGNVWVSSPASPNGGVVEISKTGGLISPSGGYTNSGLSNPQGIAIDGAGNAWVAGYGANSEISSAGVFLSGPNGFVTSDGANGIAVDASGDVWTNYVSYNFLFGYTYYFQEMVGAATPVVTPLSVGVKNNTLGTRP